MEKLGITLRTEAPHQTINHIDQSNQTMNKPDADITLLKTKLHKLFTKSHTIKKHRSSYQTKRRSKIITAKRNTYSNSSTTQGRKTKQKTKKQGHIEKAKNIDGNCFVSPAVIRIKKDKSVKIALDSRKMKEITVKKGTNDKH